MMPLKTPLHALTLALGVALAASACGASPGTAPAPAPAPVLQEFTPPPPLEQPAAEELQRTAQQYAELQQMLALAERCQWFGPAETAAVSSTRDERLAWLRLWNGDLAAAESLAESAVAQRAGVACASEEGEELRKGVQYGAWQMRITWALRAHALLGGPDQPAWTSGLSAVEEHRADLEATITAMKSRYREIPTAMRSIQGDANRALAMACAKNGKGGCPALEESPGVADYAEIWMQLAEGYAAVLAVTADKIAEPSFLTQ